MLPARLFMIFRFPLVEIAVNWPFWVMPEDAPSEALLADVIVTGLPMVLLNTMPPLVSRLMFFADVTFMDVAAVRPSVMPADPAVTLISPPVALVPLDVVRLELVA